MDMVGPIGRSISQYFVEIYRSTASVLSSLWTALPYVFGVGELRKEVTEQYPDPVSSKTEEDLPPRTRGFLMNDIEKCTGCGDCVDVCPVDCVELETEQGPEESKKWISQFDIDFGKCIFCGLCVQICAPNSLVHTKQFEGAVYVPGDLVSRFGRGRVSRELKTRWQEMRQTEGELL